MNEHLKKLVNLIRKGENDKFNPETYFNNHLNIEDGILNSQYVLGNLYAKGYSNSTHLPKITTLKSNFKKLKSLN